VRQLFRNCPRVERNNYRRTAFPDHAYSGIQGKSSRKENTTAQRIHLLLQEFKNDFYEVEILRHHPVVPWLEDYIEEIEEIMGKDPWIIHGIAENSPALKKISSSLMLKGCSKKTSP